MTCYVTNIVSPLKVRRTIAGVLRGKPLTLEQADVVRRLVLDSRTALRLLVGFDLADVSLSTAHEVCRTLAEISVDIPEAQLVRAWTTALSIADPAGTCMNRTRVTDKAARRARSADAQALRAVTDRVRAALLHLLGVTVEDLPTFELAVRACAQPRLV